MNVISKSPRTVCDEGVKEESNYGSYRIYDGTASFEDACAAYQANEIQTDNNFKLENDNIYFVGDGAGKAGNIVTAAATGLVAARDILNRK